LDHVKKRHQHSVGFVGSEGAKTAASRGHRASRSRPSDPPPSSGMNNTHNATTRGEWSILPFYQRMTVISSAETRTFQGELSNEITPELRLWPLTRQALSKSTYGRRTGKESILQPSPVKADSQSILSKRGGHQAGGLPTPTSQTPPISLLSHLVI
jgi:hypothetical protein